jgi:hypothetical protein
MHPKRIKFFRAFLSVATLALLPSCSSDDANLELRRREAQSQTQEIERSDELSTTFQSLPMLGRLDREAILREFSNQVNSWGSLQSLPERLSADRFISQLPAALQSLDFNKRLDRFELGDVECEYLWQSRVMRDIGAWVLAAPYRDPLFAEWLNREKSRLAGDDGLRLEQTLKLFDWTIRNVALEGEPKAVEKLPVDPSSLTTKNQIGFRSLPWQTVLFGHGDAIQRARVFTQLLFQQRIPAVILALPSAKPNEASMRSLWAIGVPIANELYLFEPRFGLPIPNGDLVEVAVLRQARADKNILRRCRLPGRFEYPIEADDLKEVVALLDIESPALGAPMRLLEDRLAGKNRMQLTLDADAVTSQLQAIDPDLKIELWSMPSLAQLYARMVREQVKDKTPFGITYQLQNSAYVYDSLFHEARLAHLRGEFETNLDREGAPAMYMNSRVDDATLDRLPYDDEVQMQLQVRRVANETQEEFVARLNQFRQSFRNAKGDSNFFLGLLQFDLGNWEASIDWMDERILKVGQSARWHPHARYLLARCFEQKGDWKASIEQLKTENLPQEAGNRIRARLDEQRVVRE